MHIRQGSKVTYNVVPVKRQFSRSSAARRMAISSACAVGSCHVSRRLCPVAMTSPPRTMTAPMGTSPSTCAALAASRARPMNRWSASASICGSVPIGRRRSRMFLAIQHPITQPERRDERPATEAKGKGPGRFRDKHQRRWAACCKTPEDFSHAAASSAMTLQPAALGCPLSWGK